MTIVYLYTALCTVGGADRSIIQKANYLADEMHQDVFIITDSQKERPPVFPISPRIRHIDIAIDFDRQYHHNLLVRGYYYFTLMYLYRKKLEFDTLPLLSLSERLHKLPEVDVKAKHRFTEGARVAWATEKRGQYWADVYYDCDEETERYLDEGKEIPFFKDWFMERVEFADLNNLPFFLGIDVKGALTPVELAVAKDTLVKERGSLSDEEEEAEAVANGGECKDEDYLGRYKGHPIVWILDNVYAGGGGKLAMKVPAGAKTKKNDVSFPVFLDEAKSVYITEDPSASASYHYPPFAEEVATVFVYSHGASTRSIEKGVRRTYFQGYNVPSTFENPDYSLMPPMEDFRRTLYWNPDVRTDENGEAIIEFYNNSSCREIHISAEGITPDGRCIFNK